MYLRDMTVLTENGNNGRGNGLFSEVEDGATKLDLIRMSSNNIKKI